MSAIDETVGESEVLGEASDEVNYWLGAIKRAEQDAQEWQKRCDRIRERYLFEEKNTAKKRKYQMLWANQEILRPAVYAKPPSPSVTSRFKDGDPTIRAAGQLLERTLDVQFDIGDYDSALQLVRNDYLLFAQGVPRIRYEATIDRLEVDDGAGEWEVDAQADESEHPDEPQETLKAEHVKVDFVHRKDFIRPVCRTWAELPWVCFRAFMDRRELKKRWPDIGKKIPLDSKSSSQAEDDKKKASAIAKATIYEVWDRRGGKVIWLAKEWPELLEEPAEPYLKFEGFWPCPRPAFGTLDTENLTSVPDYVYYQDQAEEVNDLTARIGALTDSLKLVGFYPAGPEGEGFPEVEAAVRPGFENKLIAVKSWAAFTKAGGQGGAPIVFLPIEEVVKTIQACIQLRKELIDDIWQITGISDIMRGDTEAEETAAAQGIKSMWGSVRLKDKQNEMARLSRDVTRLVAEVISTQFQIDTMLECANMSLPTDADVQAAQAQYQQQLVQFQQSQAAAAQQQQQAPMAQGAPNGPPGPPQGQEEQSPPDPPDLGPTQEQVLALLRDGVLRRYLVDIETDSTVMLDQAREQQARSDLIEKTGRFLVSMMPVAQQQPKMLPFLGELFLFGLRAFPAGRELEEKAEKMIEELEKAANLPPPPDPKFQLENMKAQAEIGKVKIEQQTTAMKAQAEQTKAKLDLAVAQTDHQQTMQRMTMENDHAKQQHAMNMQKLAQEAQMMEQRRVMQDALRPMFPTGNHP